MRTLWKADPVKSEIRAVEGTRWPDDDSEGDKIFDNTHFPVAADAMDSLVKDASAGVKLGGAEVERCRQALRRAEQRAAEDAVRYSKVMAAAEAFSAQPNV